MRRRSSPSDEPVRSTPRPMDITPMEASMKLSMARLSMTRLSILLLAGALTLCAGAPAFARDPQPASTAKATSGARRPALPQRNCWTHIYNSGIRKGHDAALARAEANLICG